MRTRAYEALIIFKPSGTEQELAQAATGLEESVKRIEGRVESAQPFGRRRLAFRIDHQTEGHYHLVRFVAPTERIGELKQLLNLNETIVRFLILAQDEVRAKPPAPQPSGVA